jgi:hypothetical protein
MPLPALPDLFYDMRGGGYLMRQEGGSFIPLDGKKVTRWLRKSGLDPELYDGPLNEVEDALYTAESTNAVSYAGPLGGHRIGMFPTYDGRKILVTTECSAFSRPKAPFGKFEFIETFLQELFGNEQVIHVSCWLKLAISSLLRGDFRPGQACILCGPVGCGKGLFHYLVTQLLGGRAGKPYMWMSGETNFNEDLAQAEHLYLEDEQASTDIRSRTAFGARIKQLTVNEEFQIHGKGKMGLLLPTFRRLSGSINNQPKALMILPPKDEDVMGKMNLYLVSQARSLLEDKKENKRRINEELPAFIRYLSSLRIPKAYGGDPRFGLTHWHHPEILEALGATTPEFRMLELIDLILFKRAKDKDDGTPLPPAEPWKGTAAELELKLIDSPFRFAVDKLLSWSGACGWYLDKISQTDPHRIEKRRSNGKVSWIVRAP